MQFRKTKTFGGLRFSLSKKGVAVSVGAGPLRVGVGADGKVRRTVRAPGTGLYDTKVIGSVRPSKTKPRAAPKTVLLPGEPEWAPPCTETQRRYLADFVRSHTGDDDLSLFDGISLFSGEYVLSRLRGDPADLYRDGRSPGGEQDSWAARFAL
jgi:hypothetical protein